MKGKRNVKTKHDYHQTLAGDVSLAYQDSRFLADIKSVDGSGES
jgi:hypothetical protein